MATCDDKTDAERYRWLRDNSNDFPLLFIAQRDPSGVVIQFTGEVVDRMIDELRDKPKTRKVKLLGWYNTDARRLEWLAAGVTPYTAYKRVPSEDKEIEI